MTREMLGYEGFGYQKFFMDDFEWAARLLEARHDRMEKLMFAEESTELWKEHFAGLGGLERWLLGDCAGGEEVGQIKSVDNELLRKRRETFAPKVKDALRSRGFGPGYRGPLMWYVALNNDINLKDKRNERSDWETYRTDKKVLLLLSEKDPIALPDAQMGMVDGYVKNKEQLRVEKLDTGHFAMLEKAHDLALLLMHFFEDE